MRLLTLTAAVCLAASVAGCGMMGMGTKSKVTDEAGIADFNRRYLKAINDGDATALANLTTDDHMLFAPNRPVLAGKEANDSANSRVFEIYDIDETWTPVETVITGEWAWQRGTFTVAATPKAGGTTRNTNGNFLRIYKKQANGTWRMTRDMFNTDSPPAAPPVPTTGVTRTPEPKTSTAPSRPRKNR
jgi:ketosteroid isomerase-like protein